MFMYEVNTANVPLVSSHVVCAGLGLEGGTSVKIPIMCMLQTGFTVG